MNNLARINRLFGMAHHDEPIGLRQVSGLALLGVGLMLITVGIYLNMIPARYSAEARVNLEFGQGESDKSESQKEISTNYDEGFVPTEFEFIQSRFVLSKVVEALHLDRDWGKKYGNGEKLKMDDAIGLLKRQIKLFPISNTSIIGIRAFSDNPDEAARIANEVAEAYQQSRLEESREQKSNEIKLLKEQFNEQEVKVREAQEEIDRLRKELRISDADSNTNQPTPAFEINVFRPLEALRIQSEAQYEQQKKLLDQLKSLDHDTLRRVMPTALQPPDTILTSLLEQLNQARENASTLARDSQPDDPTYKKAQQRVDDLDGKVNKRVNDDMVSLEDRFASMKAYVASLTDQIARTNEIKMKRAADTLPYYNTKQKLDRLLRFQTILDMKIAAETTDLNLPHRSTVQLVDRAVPAQRPVSPNRFLAVTLLLLGILFSVTGSVMMRGEHKTGVALHVA